MTILLAPDKFKGSLTATEAIDAMRAAVLAHDPVLTVLEQSIADGGEGTADLLQTATGGQTIWLTVMDPLFRPVTAPLHLSADGQTAFIEMATASGLQLLQASERNPLITSTQGTGELIWAALDRGVTTVVLCIGGSATTDGGVGLAAALGYRFLDDTDQPVAPVGGQLGRIARIDASSVSPVLHRTAIRVACDVANPLCGPNGAAPVYGPQKGADADGVRLLDEGLRHLARIVARDLPATDPLAGQMPGSGAAGGTGFGGRVFLNAQLEPGFRLVADYLNIDQLIASADLILTGEGQLDEQTLSGKAIGGLIEVARHHNVPVVAFCGRLTLTPAQWRALGLTDARAITPAGMPLSEAIRQAPALLQQTVQGFLATAGLS